MPRAEETEIPQVTVTGTAERESVDSTASTTIIRAEDYANRIVSVSEILSEQAGVHITRYGGLEDATSISIRGSSADEVQVLFDGVPLNTAEGGMIDLSPFLVESLDSIEISRGSGPLEYGFAPSAGTVALHSKGIGSGRKIGASVGYGSFNTFRSNLAYSNRWKNFGMVAAFGFLRTDGDFSFLDDNGTPANSADDQRVKRQNNESQTIHPFIKLEYKFDDKTRLEWVNHLIRKDDGVPGLSANQSDTSNVSATSWLASLKLRRDSFFHRNLAFTNRAYLRLTKSQYADLNGEVGLGGAQDNDNDTTLFGNQMTMEITPDNRQLITAFVLYQAEWFRAEDFLASPSQGGASVRHQWNIGVGDEIEFLNRRLLVNPAVWIENVTNRLNNDDPSFLTPASFSNTKSHHVVSARLGLKGMATPWLALKANASRGFRFPTFPELFGDRGGVVGNQALEPQESINWDAGFMVREIPPPLRGGGQGEGVHESTLFPTLPPQGGRGLIQKASLSLFYFDRQVDNLIQFEQNAGFARAENIGEARIKGVEVQGSLEAFKHVSVSANYTFQDPVNQADFPGRQLPGRPRHELETRIEGFINRGRAFVEVNWIDSNFLDPLNTRVVRDRVILNAGIAFNLVPAASRASVASRASAHGRLTFEAKNLTNDQIVDWVGFPLPGRGFFGRVDVAF
ncbi:MAG: TonB-dependent receptor [Deltaproteobacteria bacterium]|nr:TonB-dependent receptor [Deltaproteobacteria bacterium]